MRITLILLSVLMLSLVAGCGSESDDNPTNPVNPPDMPHGLTVTGTTLSSVTLDWGPVDDVTDYNLYRSGSEDGTYAEVYSDETVGYVDTDVIYASDYWYKVSAENSGGESDLSPAVRGSTVVPDGFQVSGSPGGGVDAPYNYNAIVNGKPEYQSDPVGLLIVVPASGDQANLWVIRDQIEGMNLYYHPTVTAYPSQTGWRYVYGDAETSILLTPFVD